MFAELTLPLMTAGWATAATAAVAFLDRRLHTDELTGIGNRAALRRHSRRFRRCGLVGALLIDLDHFKAINDTHGHHFGNDVLTAVAARLAEHTAPGERAVRLHGDEFALHLGRVASRAAAQRRADEIAQVLAEPLEVGGYRLTVLGSVGLAVADAGASLSDLLGAADRRMYAAKHTRRSAVSLAGRPRRVRDLPPQPDHAA
ncbi:GGDEF domain-containing protein [Saccharopolyspora sp. NFXS83]|uniref:GGDEF domain-containing protein n=1 Tax=Saccharopolyspora sp. NFXS83 TaxID=2993560 RepID=UPI00224B1567|nr:GGDEF domain-containing protein [Saccharopolyspora sp. NFXS83]MCX2732512.1 GGDEF domain-containing protein [Saccharopolyspora sp. NFXS83]